MDKQDVLLAGLDLLLAFLVLFVLGFFAVRYDEVRGPTNQILSLENLEATVEGDYSNLQYLGIFIWDSRIELREFSNGSWEKDSIEIQWDWESALQVLIERNDLPLVLYEMEPSARLGDIIRQISRSGQPIGLAKME